jgi:two-component system cell cycle response regulator
MKILIADDDRVTRGLLARRLTKWGHEVVACADGSQAWDILSKKDAPRLAILDWMMPGMDGVEVCRQVRRAPNHPYVYILMLTSKDGKADIVEGLEAGADDYIVKPFDPNELQVRVRAGVRLVKLQEDLQKALELSEFRASHDALTSLFNRGAIMEALKRELERAKREHTSLSVILADIDHFKRINDRHGHPAGDAVLKQVASIMSASVRPYDLVGRYGGEEFLIIAPGCDKVGAGRVAERIRTALSEAPIQTSEGALHVTLSLGVSEVDFVSENALDDAVRSADNALYRAKENGRNRVEIEDAIDLLPMSIHPQAFVGQAVEV